MSTNTSPLTFDQERSADIPEIHQVNVNAFGQSQEAMLVDSLRQNGGLTFSTIARRDGRIVAHAGFSPITVGEVLADPPVLALAPVAVDPPHQRQGVGSGLLRWSLDRLRQSGSPAVIVLGEPEFYRRVGFVPAAVFDIRCPYDVPAEYFLALELQSGALRNTSGMVGYRPEFAALT